MNKKDARIRRGKKLRFKMKKQGATRLCIHRTSQHIYAQIIEADTSHVIASASTLDKSVSVGLDSTSNKEAATAVGKTVAERAKEKGVDVVAFDRSGFKYHGRVKALADAAREAGLQF